MRTLLKKTLLPAALLIASISAYAVEPVSAPASKIGVFDMQQMMQTSPMVQQLNKQLQEQFKPRQDKLAALQKAMAAKLDDLNKKGASMKPEDRTKLRDSIIADRTSYQAMGESYQKDLAAAQNTAMQKMMGELQKTTNMIAEKDGYSLVIQRGAVLYFNPKFDITKQVMQALPK